MEKLLKIPISNYNNVLTVLALPNFAPLLAMGWSKSFINHVYLISNLVLFSSNLMRNATEFYIQNLKAINE